MVFRGRSPRNSIIPHKKYNPYSFENHSTADLYYDATNQTLYIGSVFLITGTMQLGCIFTHSRVYETSSVYIAVFPFTGAIVKFPVTEN